MLPEFRKYLRKYASKKQEISEKICFQNPESIWENVLPKPTLYCVKNLRKICHVNTVHIFSVNLRPLSCRPLCGFIQGREWMDKWNICILVSRFHVYFENMTKCFPYIHLSLSLSFMISLSISIINNANL